jgi:hypothetical protein
MSESIEDSVPESNEPGTSVAPSPSFAIPSNEYSDLFGLWPPELFDGFEEFVRESRQQSGFGREPPPWW